MLKLLFAVILMVVLALVAGAWLHFDPAWPIIAILATGIVAFGFAGDPTAGGELASRGRPAHWGGGHGIYFDQDDAWAAGSDDADIGGANQDDRVRR
jgi:hypothetical protein